MNPIYPPFTNIRSFISYKFSAVRMLALRDLFWAKLTGRSIRLAEFPGHGNNPNKKLLGVKDIPVEHIIGTLNRGHDFDRSFRPLKRHLGNRWVDTFITLQHDGWSPILVHKIGEDYYVEDGHQRVSVARSIGMAFIEAKIWEYPVQPRQTEMCQSMQCGKRSSAKVYASRGLRSRSVER